MLVQSRFAMYCFTVSGLLMSANFAILFSRLAWDCIVVSACPSFLSWMRRFRVVFGRFRVGFVCGMGELGKPAITRESASRDVLLPLGPSAWQMSSGIKRGSSPSHRLKRVYHVLKVKHCCREVHMSVTRRSKEITICVELD